MPRTHWLWVFSIPLSSRKLSRAQLSHAMHSPSWTVVHATPSIALSCRKLLRAQLSHAKNSLALGVFHSTELQEIVEGSAVTCHALTFLDCCPCHSEHCSQPQKIVEGSAVTCQELIGFGCFPFH